MQKCDTRHGFSPFGSFFRHEEWAIAMRRAGWIVRNNPIHFNNQSQKGHHPDSFVEEWVEGAKPSILKSKRERYT